VNDQTLNVQPAQARAATEVEYLSAALDAAGQGVWDYDGATGTWRFSAAWKRMRGIPETEVYAAQGIDWLDCIHPDDRAMVKEITERQYAGRVDEVAFEYREKHRDGHWIWILARGRCLEGHGDGKPVRIIGTDTDVTEIKRRELEFAAMSHRLELALSTSRVGVWEVDVQTGEELWDARQCELFGLGPGPASIQQETWENRVHPEDRDQAIAAFRDGLAEDRGYASDYRIVLPSGEIRYIRSRASVFVAGDGRRKAMGVDWDVTPDIERAEALARAKQLAEERSRELEAAQHSLEHASLHDALTGLPNRRCMDKALARFANDGSDQSLALLHIDLDRFKQINDTKGHAAGDAVLIHMAGLLRGHVRPGDLVARIGGDEFVVLLSPAPDSSTLRSIVDRIMLDGNRPFLWNGQECRSGVSIGVAEAQGSIDARQLLINADIALYRAKRAGRNCASYFTHRMQAEAVANKQCADDILKGLERGEFEPYYQPQFDAKTLDIAGLEALVRWRHPERGLLPPAKFLAVAGDINAIGAIDRIILEQAVRHMASWDALGIRIPRISVNVSARRLGDAVLLEHLKALPVEPHRISFELHESIFLDDHDDALAGNIAALKHLGFNIDIDDFGTGHASIVSLLRVNPHRLKIDRQLVLPVTESEAQRRLVRSIVEIGKSQDIAICAEGVETAQHAVILRDLGCDYLQGYYFAKPMAARDVPVFIKKRRWLGQPQGNLPVVIPDGSSLRNFMRVHAKRPSKRKAS
jgi:diguanylate cyclase (GGDEF)-like protein/PAS domain S-box-containing protein